jgi:hypothetical protein
MALTKKQRAELRMKFGGRCAYCGCELPEKGWHADHVEAALRNGNLASARLMGRDALSQLVSSGALKTTRLKICSQLALHATCLKRRLVLSYSLNKSEPSRTRPSIQR